MFGLFGPKHRRLLYKIERNLISLEAAAEAGAWQAASVYAARQDPLLAQLDLCEGVSEEEVYRFFSSRKLVRSITDPDYMDWITDELSKRNLLPM